MRARSAPDALRSLVALVEINGAPLLLPLQRLFDDLPNVVFFLKDSGSRYLAVNRTLVERCGFADKADVLGRRPSELFPAPLAALWERQDREVLRTQKAVLDKLELHVYPNRRRGWCLTSKYPIADAHTRAIAAVAGLSRDVETSPRGAATQGFHELARVLETIQQRLAEPPTVEELAAVCEASPAQFSRLVYRVFGLTPRQLTLKIRLDEALHLLTTSDAPLTDVALQTGFCDQSAFTRHFRRLTGLPPATFRKSQTP